MSFLSDVFIVLIIIIGIGAILLLWTFVFPLIYDYRVTDSSVEILLFRFFPIRRVVIRDIAEVRLISWRETISSLPLYFAESWGNRLWHLWRQYPGVLIRKNKGLSKSLLLTPKDPQTFIHVVKERMKERGREE